MPHPLAWLDRWVIFFSEVFMRASISIRGATENADAEGEVNMQRGMDVLDAAYHTAHGFPGGVPALALRMGISANVLMSKVNPGIDSHHLTLKQAQTMMDVTENESILRALADHRGYDLMLTIPAQSSDVNALYWQAASEFAEFLRAVTEAKQHGISKNSVRRIDRCAADAMAHMHNLQGAMRALLPTPPKES